MTRFARLSQAIVPELKGQNDKLSSDLAERLDQCASLSVALEEEKVRASAVENEFEAYRKAHKINDDLGALQSAVAAMQAKLEGRQDE